jgi:hypothetical protein
VVLGESHPRRKQILRQQNLPQNTNYTHKVQIYLAKHLLSDIIFYFISKLLIDFIFYLNYNYKKRNFWVYIEYEINFNFIIKKLKYCFNIKELIK